MLKIGDEVEGFRIDGTLGHGGMGVVYEATQIALDRKVALKILAAHLTEDPTFRRRFQREGRIQAAIDHPHIVTVYGAGETEDGLFIAMRLVRGPTLKDLIRSGDLTTERTLTILGQVADALDAAHEAGLIHRDVKPQNVLIAARDHSYLADFGLTKGPDHTGLTKSDQFLGTIDYVSPEQIRGEDAVQASDTYALGGMLYECLTGTVPFPKQSDTAVLFAHVSEPPPRVTDIRPDLPAALDGVIAQAMAKDPADRFSTASALVDAAQAACPGAPAPSGGGPPHGSAALVTPTRTLADVPPTVADVPATVADVPATVAEQASPTVADTVPVAREPDDSQDQRGSRARVVRVALLVVAGLALVVAALVLLLGGGDSGTKPPAKPRTTGNADLTVRHPRSWRADTAAPLVLRRDLEKPFSLKPASPTTAGLVAGMSRDTGVNLVPVGIDRRLTKRPPTRTPVRLGAYEGYRYTGIRLTGFRRALTLYVIPTTTGVATLFCYGPAGASTTLPACEQIVGTVVLRTGKTGPLGPDRALATTLAAAMKRLNEVRRTERRAIADATTASAIPPHASAIATRYRKAAAEVHATDVTPEALPAQAAVRASFLAARTAYDQLASAAEKDASDLFTKRSRQVRLAEQAVNKTLTSLEQVGYRVDG